MLLRRVIILLVFNTLIGYSITAARLGVMLTVACVFAVQLVVQPYDQAINNVLESFGLLLVLVVVGVNSMQQLSSVARAAVLIVLLFCGCAALLSPLLLQLVRRVLQTVRKTPSDEREVAEEQAITAVTDILTSKETTLGNHSDVGSDLRQHLLSDGQL